MTNNKKKFYALVILISLTIHLTPVKTNEIVINQINKESIHINSETEIPIFGYKLDINLKNPIERDDYATLKIYQYKEKSVDIEINTKFGNFRYANLILDEELLDNSIESPIKRFEVESIFDGFFMEFVIMNNTVSVNIAFEENECQLSFDGIMYGNFPEISNYNKGDTLLPSSEQLTIIELMKQYLKEKQEKGLLIYKNPSLLQDNSEVSKTSRQTKGISFTKFGVAHDLYDLDKDHSIDNPSYLRKLPDYYWEPYSSIDIGIWRYMPSESQIKSDLQYYNKDYIQNGYGYIRDLLAYNVLSHDVIIYAKGLGPEWEVYQWQSWFWIWWQAVVGLVYPNEIRGLWYHYYNPSTGVTIDVHPWNSLIFAHLCNGWSYGLSGPRGPTMAHAFCDYGAGAFVGSHTDTYAWGENDLPDPARIIFWDSLCQQNEDVGTALNDYCDVLYLIFGYNQRPEWHIMGSSGLTI